MTKKTSKPRSSQHGDVALGQLIRVRRVEEKMSQSDLAAALGLSFQQIQKYEKGVNRVTFVRLQEIAKILNVPVSYFMPSQDAHENEKVSLTFLDPSYSLRLLRAYSKLAPEVGRRFVALMEACS